jgi:hypothetical protein
MLSVEAITPFFETGLAETTVFPFPLSALTSSPQPEIQKKKDVGKYGGGWYAF